MKMIALLAAGLAVLSVTYVYRIHTLWSNTGPVLIQKQILQRKLSSSFSCSPDLQSFDFSDTTNAIPLLSGWGSYTMPVSVTQDSARIYFQQGINMYYGFHIIEALASFEKAVRFEPGFAMGWWGKALAYGPNINDLGYTASPEALAAVAKAEELAEGCSAIEKALISAMKWRYSADTTQTREYLNQLYADAMQQVAAQFPASPDAAALYADALMVQHPWDLYDTYGTPKPWTPLIVSTLEKLLDMSPNHPGACHYYIHAIEGSAHPEKGIAVANRLPGLMPGVAHLVHMPSHIYIRSGYYNEGVDVNIQAVKGYYNTVANYAPVSGNSMLYLVHNLHMQSACANMDGRFADAMQASRECADGFDSAFMDFGGYIGAYAQYLYMTPYLTLIRFGKWDQVLNTPAIPESRVYAHLLWRFGRGLSYARRKDFNLANDQLAVLRNLMKEPQLQESPPAFNAAVAGAGIAEKILEAVITQEKGDLHNAILLYKEAVKREDAMKYNEPRDWVHPARQYLGDALIKDGRYREAEKVYTEDLSFYPNNGWSLTGLALALQLQGKNKQAVKIQDSARKAFIRSDVKVPGSVF